MKVIKVIVDEMPQGCQACKLCESNGDYTYGYHCAALPGDGSNDLGNVYDYLFRRHDCPLEVKPEQIIGKEQEITKKDVEAAERKLMAMEVMGV